MFEKSVECTPMWFNRRTTARSQHACKPVGLGNTRRCRPITPKNLSRTTACLLATYRRRCCRPWRRRHMSWGWRGWRSCPPCRCPTEWAHRTNTTCSRIPRRRSRRPTAPPTHSSPRRSTCSSSRLTMCSGRSPPEPSPRRKPWTRRRGRLRGAW